MEFNLGAILIGIVSLLLLILPFVLDYRNRKKKENSLLQPLKKLAQQQNSQINDYEVCKNFIIGIDKKENNIFFYKEEKDTVISHFIDLDDIQTCKVINSHKIMTSTQGNYKAVIKLELSFISNNKTEQIIEFFNAQTSPQLYGEIQLVEKWCKLINKQLNSSLVAQQV